MKHFPLLLCAALSAATDGGSIQFREHTIATALKGGYQVVPADVDGDGRVDLIALASGIPELAWYRNPDWTRHVFAGGLNRMINVAALTSPRGVEQLVVAHEFANQAKNSIGIVSVLTRPADLESPWPVREIDRLTTSHRLRVASIDRGASPVVINSPLTGASAEPPQYRDHAPLVFYRPGEWKREQIGDENEGVVHGIFVTDWNGDHRDDVLTASFLGLHLYQRQNKGWRRIEMGKGSPAGWPKSGSSDVTVVRSGRKKLLAAIEPWHGNQVAVYEQNGGNWRRQVIDDTLVDGHTIVTADFDGDGREEIVAGYRGTGRSVYLYTNVKAGWQRQKVDDGGIAAAACAAVDLNSDKRPDIACIGSATANLKWYENLGSR